MDRGLWGNASVGASVTYATKELTPATWADFERLFAPGRGWSLLRGALKAIRERGGGLVEAYPTLTPRNSNWEHAGTVSLFERAGFIVVGWPSEKYVVMQREA